jgi:hypothetical protein
MQVSPFRVVVTPYPPKFEDKNRLTTGDCPDQLAQWFGHVTQDTVPVLALAEPHPCGKIMTYA